MSHNLEVKNGKHSIAYLGSRKDVWHRLGQEMPEGASIEVWAKEAGLDWEAELCNAWYEGHGGRHFIVPNQFHVVRKDTNYPLGYVTGRYKIVQPAEVLAWFQQYISVDERFTLDVAGCLKSGEIVWATAKFNGDIEVAGDAHKARLLMTTTFDGTGATINKMTMTRVVCNNTLDVALFSGKGATVKTTHSAKFDAETVGKQLGALAASIDNYKKFGNAMVQVHYSQDQVEKLFKDLLGMKDASTSETVGDNSTRKIGQFNDMISSYAATVREGTKSQTMWAALNAVTRYVDHDRGTRNTGTGTDDEARFISAQFTSGAAMKKKAVELLTSDPKLQAALTA